MFEFLLAFVWHVCRRGTPPAPRESAGNPFEDVRFVLGEGLVWTSPCPPRSGGDVRVGRVFVMPQTCLYANTSVTVHPMATHLRDNTTISSAADVCASIAGALDSEPQTKQLAPTWDSLTTKADGLVLARRNAERTLARARARLAVLDAVWDPEVAAFGRDIVDQSGGNREAPLYKRFFKTVTPSGAQDFGMDREVQQGRDWLAELNREPNEPIAVKWSPRLKHVTDNLADGVTARKNALQTLGLQGTAEELFIEDVNRELDILEGELLKLFPGQPKRVAAFLEATRPSTTRRNESESTSGNG